MKYILGAIAAYACVASAAAAAVSTFEQVSPDPTLYANGVDFGVFTGSPIGEAMAALETPAALGCLAGDFAGFTPGSIALISRGDCNFGEKVQNAADAGASGAVIYNDVPGLVLSTLGGLGDIVAVYITQALGVEFLAALERGPLIVSIAVVEPSEVPLPPALWVFGAGLFGLNFVRRKKRSLTQR